VKRIVLALCLMLPAIAATAAAPDPLLRALNNCVTTEARRVDDGRSDASTVALVILGRLCRSQVKALARADAVAAPPSPGTDWTAPGAIETRTDSYIRGFLLTVTTRVLVLRRR
jgi:hypothetical protein